MPFNRRNMPMTENLKKEISGAKHIFEVFYSMSRETPPGAYPLNTGEWIRGCKTMYPEFYQKAVEYRSKSYIRTGTNAQYESELSTTGQSGMFVIEGEDIRLPKVTRYIRGYESERAAGVHNNVYLSGVPDLNLALRYDVSYPANQYPGIDKYGKDCQSLYNTSGVDEPMLDTSILPDAAKGGDLLKDDAYTRYKNNAYGFANEVVAPCVAMALYIQVFNHAEMAGYVDISNVLKVITNYTNQMDQKIQQAIDSMNAIIAGGALGMPEYERGTNLGENAYVKTYSYNVPSDGWFYARWNNYNVDPTRITKIDIYKDSSKSQLLATHTTSDGRRAGKDAGTTDQTIFIPVRKGYHLVVSNSNYRRFYPVFGQ